MISTLLQGNQVLIAERPVFPAHNDNNNMRHNRAVMPNTGLPCHIATRGLQPYAPTLYG